MMEKLGISESLEPQNLDAKTLGIGFGSSGLFGLSENCTGLASFGDVSVQEKGEKVELDGTDTRFGVDNVEVITGMGIEGGDGEYKVMGSDAIENVFLSNGGIGGEDWDQAALGEMEKGGLDGDGVEMIATEGVKPGADSGLKMDDSDGKVEVNGGGISLFVEFNVPSSGINLDDIDGGDNYEFLTGEDNAKEAENEEEMIVNQDFKYLVGDIVWIKTRNKTWWPGKIYDPSDASKKYAAKSDQRHSLLVDYFGSGYVGWCSPSQLKPFYENFEQMLGQYKSRGFAGAVEKGAYEFGRCIQSDMACSCTRESQLPVGDSGIKEELVSAPDRTFRELGKFSVANFEPVKLLEDIKHFARTISMPGLLELVAAQNQLSAFYRSIGHSLLPMHQLTETTDVKNNVGDSKRARKKINSHFKDPNPGLSKLLKEDVAVDVKSIKCELGSNEEVQGLDSNMLDSKENGLLGSPENVVGFSVEYGKGAVEGNLDKGFESRGRKKSKYLSYPYINLEHKGSPDESEGLANGQDEVGNTPSIVKCSGKKSQKNQPRKFNESGYPELVNASSADLLSELHLTALDCLYPKQNEKFDSIEWFYYKYRASLFRVEFNEEMLGEQNAVQMNDMGAENLSPVAKPEPKKRKRKEKVISRPSEAGLTPIVQDVNGQPDKPGISSPPSEVKLKRRRRKKEDSGTKTQPPCIQTDMNVTVATISQSAPTANCEPEENKGGDVPTSLCFQTPGVPDLNGSSTMLSFSSKDSQATGNLAFEVKPQPKKRKRKEANATICSHTESSGGVLGMNGTVTERGSLVIALQSITPPSISGNSVPSTGPPDLSANTAKPGFLINNLQGIGLIPPEVKPVRRRKRKEKTTSEQPDTAKPAFLLNNPQGIGLILPEGNLAAGIPDTAKPGFLLNNPHGIGLILPEGNLAAGIPNTTKPGFLLNNPHGIGLIPPEGNLAAGIPDLNGTSSEPSTLGEVFRDTNCVTPQVQPEQKKRRRRRRRINGEPVQIPEISMGHGRAEASRDALGTALLLTFARGVDLPSKELLAHTFRRFGSLKESETQVLKDTQSARVVFAKGADAGEAFRSLEKSNPFGANVVNYRLHHLSAASQPKEGYKAPPPPKPSLPPKPSPSEARNFDFIMQNIKMMKSVLEKDGNNLPPEMKAQLEREIKSLEKKVSTIGCSSSS